MTVSVEIKAPGQGAHPNAAKETQILKIDQENQPETWEVIVTDPSSGEFKLTFKHPTSLENISTDAMKSNVSASDFNSQIYHKYYKHQVGSSTATTRVMYDENGDVTEDLALAKTIKYKVVVEKRIASPAFANLTVLKDPANSSVLTLVKPTDLGGTPSSAPLRGNYVINCPDPSNPAAIFPTREIRYDQGAITIEHVLQKDIPFLPNKVRVKDLRVKGEPYKDNARRFAIVFEGMDVDMPQCYLTPGASVPLSGENPFFEASTLTEFGETLMFEPIPQEMLYTAETRPQVLVNVDGVPAACANLNCDYMYVDTTALITSQSLLNGNTLSIMG